MAPAPSCQAAQAALPASHTVATVAGLTAERLPCLEWRPLKCPNHLRSSVTSSEKPSLTATRRLFPSQLSGLGPRSGPPALAAGRGLPARLGRRDWAPFGLLLRPGLPSSCPCSPLGISSYGWQLGTVTPQTRPQPCFPRVPAKPLRQAHGRGLSTWRPAPPRGNLQTSGVHCRGLASCEAGAAASLCSGSGAQQPRRSLRRRGIWQRFCVQETETNSG